MNSNPAPSTFRRTRWRLPLSLAAIALLVGGAGAIWQWQLAKQLDREKAQIESLGGKVYFADEITEEGELVTDPVERNLLAYLSRKPLNINLHKVKGAAECLKIASTYDGLWQIDLSESDVSDADLPALEKITSLRHLLIHDTAVGDDVLATARKLPNLETLDLSRTKVSGSGLAKWKPGPTLKTLMLLDCELEESSLTGLKDHPRLETLRICDTQATSKCLEQIGTLPRLSELDISGALIDDDAVPTIARLSKLTTLIAADTKFSENGVWELVHATLRAREIDLSHLPISERALAELNYSRALATLSVSDCPFTDEMVLQLFDLKFLKEFNCEGSKITADGVVRLIEHKDLNILRISQSLLSNQQREYIRSMRPKLELIESPTVSQPAVIP